MKELNRHTYGQLIIRETQTKAIMGYHLMPVTMASIQKMKDNMCEQGYGEKGTPVHCWWECKLIQSLWATVQMEGPQKMKNRTTIQQTLF